MKTREEPAGGHACATASSPALSTTGQLPRPEAPLGQAQAPPFLSCPWNCHVMDAKTRPLAFPKPTVPSHPHATCSSKWVTFKQEPSHKQQQALWPRGSWRPSLLPSPHMGITMKNRKTEVRRRGSELLPNCPRSFLGSLSIRSRCPCPGPVLPDCGEARSQLLAFSPLSNLLGGPHTTPIPSRSPCLAIPGSNWAPG